MKNLSEIADKSGNFISLSKLTDKKIKDVVGYFTNEFGEPCFKLCSVEFEDGSVCFAEGEHDLPYLINLPISQEETEHVYNQQN